ncbi:MAG: hypothetical protein V3S06_06940, partial [candidate division Zixibacteria bacterium]
MVSEFFRLSGVKPPTEAIAKFRDRLESLGLLESIDETQTAEPADPGLWKKRALLQKILFLKLKALDPERFLTELSRITDIFYSRLMIPLYFVLILIAVAIFLSNGLELAQQLKRSLIPETIVFVWLTTIYLTLLHELSHALTCKRHGGRVSEFGVLLLYLQICFYVNVSDAYLFEDKKKRIKVTLAGAKSQMVIWALAVMVWRITAVGNFINQAAFLVIAVTFIMIAFNVNPLLKLDGYYYLVDKWNIPNLRARAFGYWKAIILKFLFKIEPDTEPSLRERRIFKWYGLAAILFSSGLFGYIFFKLSGLLFSWTGILGVAILTLFVLYLVYEALKKSGILMAAINERGRLLRPRNWIILVVLSASLVALSLIIKIELKIGHDCLIYPIESLALRSSEPGFVELVLDRGSGDKSSQRFSLAGDDLRVLSITPVVKEGDLVRAGEMIARISSSELPADLAESRAGLDRAESQLQLLKKGPRPEEISQVEDLIMQVRMKLKKSDADLSRSEELASKGLIPVEKLEETRTSNEVLKSELGFYKKQKTLLKLGARPEEIDIAEAEIRAIQAKIDRLETHLAAENITSPINGVVTSVKTGSEILHVARIDTMRIRIPVPEKEISAVVPGRMVKFRT